MNSRFYELLFDGRGKSFACREIPDCQLEENARKKFLARPKSHWRFEKIW